jgi:hypothetical protein
MYIFISVFSLNYKIIKNNKNLITFRVAVIVAHRISSRYLRVFRIISYTYNTCKPFYLCVYSGRGKQTYLCETYNFPGKSISLLLNRISAVAIGQGCIFFCSRLVSFPLASIVSFVSRISTSSFVPYVCACCVNTINLNVNYRPRQR